MPGGRPAAVPRRRAGPGADVRRSSPQNNRPLRGSPRKGKTEFIVADNGHILPGVPKKMTAFNDNVNSSARWPQGNPAIMGSSNATMGYKGITTSYLPQSTVHLKTYALGGPENTYR